MLQKKRTRNLQWSKKKQKILFFFDKEKKCRTKSHLFQNRTFVVFFWAKLEKSSNMQRCRREHRVILVDEQKKKLSIRPPRNVFLLRRNCWRPGKFKSWPFRQSLNKKDAKIRHWLSLFYCFERQTAKVGILADTRNLDWPFEQITKFCWLKKKSNKH